MNRPSINPGRVEWSGERHAIFLKDSDDSDFTALIALVTVVLSPYGNGSAAFVLAEPDKEAGWPNSPNLLLTDNQSLARWLLENWLGKMVPFSCRAGLKGASWLDLQAASWIRGMPNTECRAKLHAPDLELELSWKDLGSPIPLAVSASSSETGKHEMHSVIVEARDATATLNGRMIQGAPVNWRRFGLNISSACLSLSETWITPSE